MIDISPSKSDTARFFSDSLAEPETILIEKTQEPEYEPSTSDYCVLFSERSVSYCIGIVDMVGSTKLAAILGMSKMPRYYQNFLNLMSKIIEVYGGRVIKNIGDCLLFCFPQTVAIQNKSTIAKCLECSLAMIDAHEFLCRQMKKDGLPCVDYRISIDYGHVIPMKTSDSKSFDVIGPAVNMCNKINRCAEKNGVVVGGDLHHIAKQIDGVTFKEIKGYSVGFKLSYPVYHLTRSLRSDVSI